MNTASSSLLTAPAAVSPILVTSPSLAAAEQEAENLLNQLHLAQERVTQERAAAEQAAKDKRHAQVVECLAQLGAQSAMEAVRIIEAEMGLKPTPVQAPKTKRGFPAPLSADTKAQMRAMFEANSTSRQVAEALGIGLSTADSWKAKLGLTNRGLGGRPGVIRSTKRAPKLRKASRKRMGRHFTPAQIARIEVALKKPDYCVALIADRERSSREAIYGIRRRMIKQGKLLLQAA